MHEADCGAATDEFLTQDEFEEYATAVTDAMTTVINHFVTPLSRSTEDLVHLVGTGTYINVSNMYLIITCGHVLDDRGFNHGFHGSPTIYSAARFARAEELDAGLIYVDPEIWHGATHDGKMLTTLAFADRFCPMENEIFFLMGFAGENSHFGFDNLVSTATCYSSQLSKNVPLDERYFYLPWKPGSVRITPATTEETARYSKSDDPSGLSGSLVWDTGFVRTFKDDGPWTPDIARVVGIVERWDYRSETLLVRRIEHILPWMIERAGST